MLITAAIMIGWAMPSLCPQDHLQDAIKVRLDRIVLQELWPVALENIPETIAIAPNYKTFNACSTNDGLFSWSSLDAHLALSEAEMFLKDGGLDIDISGSGSVIGNITVDVCGIGEAVCEVDIGIRDISASLGTSLGVSQCLPSSEVSGVDLYIPDYALDISISDCSIYDDAVTVVEAVLGDLAIDLVSDIVPSMLQDAVNGFIPELLEEQLLKDFETELMKADFSIQNIEVDQLGIQASLGGKVTPKIEAPALCFSSPPSLADLSPGIPARQPPTAAPIGISMSPSLVQHAIDVAWYTGLLCHTTDSLGIDVGEVVDQFITGLEVDVLMTAPLRPVLAKADPGSIGLNIPKILGALTTNFLEQGDSDITIATGAELSLKVGFDTQFGTLTLDLDDFRTHPIDIDLPDGAENISPEVFGEILERSVLPLLPAQLPVLPLMNGIFDGLPLAVEPTFLATESNHLLLGLNIWTKDPNDTDRPTTSIEMPPAVIGRKLDVIATSTDTQTPSSLMRHKVWETGFEEEVGMGPIIQFRELKDGFRSYNIQAIDLNDNTAGNIESFNVYVDSVPPKVELPNLELGIVYEEPVTIETLVSDNYTQDSALRITYEVEMVGARPSDDIVLEKRNIFADQDIVLRGLPDTSIIFVTVTVEDEAGNTAEASHSFGTDFEPGGPGCQNSRASFILMLLMWSFAFGLRHRNRRILAKRTTG